MRILTSGGEMQKHTLKAEKLRTRGGGQWGDREERAKKCQDPHTSPPRAPPRTLCGGESSRLWPSRLEGG